jgi:hypothetical protein
MITFPRRSERSPHPVPCGRGLVLGVGRLGKYGPIASVEAAGWLGSAGSSVTRLADHLEGSGHLRRRREPPDAELPALMASSPLRGPLVTRVDPS